MPEPFKYRERKDDELKLSEYQVLATYVYMFNEIKKNPRTYGYTGTGTDKDIDKYISEQMADPNQTFLKSLGIEDSVDKSYFIGYPNNAKYRKIISQAISHAAEKVGVDVADDYSKFSGRPSNNDMALILNQKRDATLEDYKARKKVSSGKPFYFKDADPSKNGSGALYRQYEAAEDELAGKKATKRSLFGKFAWRIVRTIGSVALAGAGLAVCFPATAAALGVATTVARLGLVIAGAGTSYFGVKRTLANALESGYCWKDYMKAAADIKDFEKSRGQYRTVMDGKNGKTVKGLKDIRNEQFMAQAVTTYIEKGEFVGKDAWLKKYFNMACKRDRMGLKGEAFFEKSRKEYLFCSDINDKKGFQTILSKLNADEVKTVFKTDKEYFEVEDELKDIKNFTQIETVDGSGNKVKRDRSVTELIQSYERLDEYGTKFKDSIEANIKYKQAYDALDLQLIDALNNEVFEKPYSAENMETVKRMLESSVVKKRLTTSTKFGDLSSKVKSYVSFIEFEQDSENDTLKEGLKVGVVGQLSTDKNDIINSVKEMGADATTDVIAAANTISTSTSRTTLETLDLTTIANDDARNYLEAMKEKKIAACKMTESEILNGITLPADATKEADIRAIARDIANVREEDALYLSVNDVDSEKHDNVNTITEIRTKIANLPEDTPEDKQAKKELKDKLFKQFDSFERKRDLEVKPGALKAVRSEKVPNIAKLIEEIKKVDITSDPKASENKIDKLYKDTIDTVKNDPALKEYLTVRLGEEIYEKIRLEVKAMEEDAVNKTLPELVSTLKKITQSRYLTQMQKEKLIDNFERNVLEKATNIQFAKYEKTLMTLKPEDQKVIGYLDKEYPKGGFRNYIKMGTAYGKTLDKRIQRLQKYYKDGPKLFELRSSVCKGFEDHTEDELKVMCALFFNRSLNDSMEVPANRIKMISGITDSYDASKLSIKSTDVKNSYDTASAVGDTSVFGQIKNQLKQIRDRDVSVESLNDKLLYILELKRTSMLGFKSHMNLLLNQINTVRGSQPIEAFINDPVNVSYKQAWDAIIVEWKKAANAIDAEYEAIKVKLVADHGNKISDKALKTLDTGTSGSMIDYIKAFNPDSVSSLVKTSMASTAGREMG